MSRRSWPGLVTAVRRFFFGAANPPKAKRFGETTTPTTSSYYEGMPEDYRWFRQDELVRKCVVTNAYFATMTAGFETALDPTEESVNVEISATAGEVTLFDYAAGVFTDIVGETAEDAATADTVAKVWLGKR